MWAVKLTWTEDSLEVTGREGEVIGRIPLNELDALVLAQPAVSLSGGLLAELGRRRIAVVCCDRTYVPMTCMLPAFVECSHRLQVLRAQIEQSVPARKRSWQWIIKAKIAGQARVLRRYRQSEALFPLVRGVRSGDAGNQESRAAVIYWKKLSLFPARRRDAPDANRLLNYVYAFLYAAASRYIFASGLEPRLGLRHSNPTNPFCLASDLMEPYRPFADECVLEVLEETQGDCELTLAVKRALTKKLYEDRVSMGEEVHTVFEGIRRTVLSYRAGLLGKTAPQEIEVPWGNDKD